MRVVGTHGTAARRSALGRFLTAEDDWIARHQGVTMLLLWLGALIVPGVIEWMI